MTQKSTQWGRIAGSCPAPALLWTQLNVKSNSDESININVTSCDEMLRAGNATTNLTRPDDKKLHDGT